MALMTGSELAHGQLIKLKQIQFGFNQVVKVPVRKIIKSGCHDLWDKPGNKRVQMTCGRRKQTLTSLSLSYQKKDGRAWPPIFLLV